MQRLVGTRFSASTSCVMKQRYREERNERTEADYQLQFRNRLEQVVEIAAAATAKNRMGDYPQIQFWAWLERHGVGERPFAGRAPQAGQGILGAGRESVPCAVNGDEY